MAAPRRAGKAIACRVVMLIAIGVTSSAYAHAVLLDSYPEQASMLASAPAEVRLHFNEEITPVSVRVLDSGGHSVVDADAISTTDTTIHVRMPSQLAPGSYVVSYRVLSADSHPVGDSFVFSIGHASADIRAAQRSVDFADEGIWQAVANMDRALFYAALLLVAGGAMFLAQFSSRLPDLVAHSRSSILTIAAIAGVAAVGGVVVNGALLEAVPIGDFALAQLWRTGWQSSLGTSVAAALAGLGLISAAMALTHVRLRSIALVGGAVATVGGLTVTGHAAAASPRWLMSLAVGVHALCAAYWIGALLPLRRQLVTQTPRAAASIVAGFSRVAMVAVIILFVAGVAIACVQVGRLAALFGTPYGRLLLIKVALFTLLLLLATLNKWRYTPGLASGGPISAKSLRRTINIELAVAAAIVIATAVLGGLTPPRALIEQEDGRPAAASSNTRISLRSSTGDRTATVAVASDLVGSNTLAISLSDGSGAPLPAVEVSVLLGSTALAIEPRAYRATMKAPGRYLADAVQMPIAGVWDVTVEATVTDFEKASFSGHVSIR